jgi:Methyltransferase FkbM domain
MTFTHQLHQCVDVFSAITLFGVYTGKVNSVRVRQFRIVLTLTAEMCQNNLSKSSAAALGPNGERVTIIVLLVLLIVAVFFKSDSVPYQTNVRPTTPHQTTSTTHTAHVDTISFRTTAEACKPANLTDRPVNASLKAQSGEDVILLQWFNGLCNGTYFEMGALNGVTYSNTYFFNRVLHWQGLLVELSPSSYKALKVNRPNELAVVHAAVCNDDDDQPTALHFYERDNSAVNGIWEFSTESFRKQWWPGVRLEDTTPINCRSLKDIMANDLPKTDGGNYFDFGSLDCEGCEWTALQSIDWQRTAFGILLVEADGHNHRKNLAIRTFLQSKGYIYKDSVERSDWFVHSDFHSIYHHLLYTVPPTEIV